MIARWSRWMSVSRRHVYCAVSGTELDVTMKYQLYYYPGNANLAPHIVLEEAGCEVELVLVDRAARAQKSAEYLQLNPNGRIPTLVCGDLVVFEAAAICVHVAGQHPEARLIPPLGALPRAHF